LDESDKFDSGGDNGVEVGRVGSGLDLSERVSIPFDEVGAESGMF
jgi:hypothetical protein